MNRLIDVRPVERALPSLLEIGVGDVLRFSASGGRVTAGTAVELLGILTQSVLGTDGSVLTPQGAPNVVLFRACRPGHARIDVVTGDPWRSPSTHSIDLTVAP